MSRKHAIVKLDNMKETFFVRKQLNESHVLYLKRLRLSGAKLPPIVVVGHGCTVEYGTVIDGRHRLKAYREIGITEELCELIDVTSLPDAYAVALAANSEGSLTPSTGDIWHVMRLFLEQGINVKEIVRLITSHTAAFPEELLRQYLKEVRGEMYKARINKAIAAMAAENLSPSEAASRFKVEASALIGRIKTGKSRKTDFTRVRMDLRNRYVGVARTSGNHIKNAFRRYETGEVDAEFVKQVLAEVENHAVRIQGHVSDWRRRFEALQAAELANRKGNPLAQQQTVLAMEERKIPHANKLQSDLRDLGLE